MSSARKRKRRCKVCDKPERTRSIGGIRLTNIPQYLGICADCIKESSVYRKLVGSLQASPNPCAKDKTIIKKHSADEHHRSEIQSIRSR
jgi:hypothetical protein